MKYFLDAMSIPIWSEEYQERRINSLGKRISLRKLGKLQTELSDRYEKMIEELPDKLF